uniref:Acyltransferase n=2 Tax=unclassified Prevotella TaxID=2638335 RepID=A0AB33JUS4_9BACT
MPHRTKKILDSLITIVVKLYPKVLHDRFVRLQDKVFSAWIKKSLGYVGQNSFIHLGVSIGGGGEKNITIGENCDIAGHTLLECWTKFNNQQFTPRLVIGDNCHIGEYNHITAIDEVIIGKGVLTGRYVLISDNNHGTTSFTDLQEEPIKRVVTSRGPVRIGDNVWIGDKVAILSGISIGEGAVIGANAVVTKDVPPYSVVAGVPAKVIQTFHSKQFNQ